MRIGIYNRTDEPSLPSIEWMVQNSFDSFEIYSETIIDEFDDISEREKFNMLLYDAEYGHIDAVYVKDLLLISKITLKLLQALIEIQKQKLPIYYSEGCIVPSNQLLSNFQVQIQNHWKKIADEVANIDFKHIDDQTNP